ncbi:MAG: hypothetical protein CFE21_17310 [Bacteroidetes bacterium B1(2017)]|nr:MAG: hypothetical protein CFE21_17310 [Bacteroidetes bacterium B1(2017)]
MKKASHLVQYVYWVFTFYFFVNAPIAKAQCAANFSVNQEWYLPNIFSFDGSSSKGLNLNYEWDFGEGVEAYGPNTFKVFKTPGEHEVCLHVWSSTDTNCQDTYCQKIWVGCVAQYTYKVDKNLATRVFFSNKSTHDSNTVFTWDFGDGSSSRAFEAIHTYTSFGYYTVCLTLKRTTSMGLLCYETYCDSLLIGSPNCISYFGVENSLDSPTVFFPTHAGTSSMLYNWSFGDGDSSSLKYPTHTYAADSNYKVCLKIMDTLQTLCTDEYCRMVYNHKSTPFCTAQFTDSKDRFYSGPGYKVNFVPQTTYSSNKASYLWSFGDGDSSNNLREPTHIYTKAGAYRVCLSVLNTISACKVTDCHSVYVPDSLASSLAKDLLETNFRAYPNPISDELTIEIGEQYSKALNYSIIDMQGREMAQGSIPAQTGSRKTTLSVQHLPKGVYIVRVGSEGAYYYHKLLK